MSIGGALGGVPTRPELRPSRPSLLSRVQEPEIVTDLIVAPPPVAQVVEDLQPQLTSRSLRPTLTSDDNDPC
jgi:hypothetical protein